MLAWALAERRGSIVLRGSIIGEPVNPQLHGPLVHYRAARIIARIMAAAVWRARKNRLLRRSSPCELFVSALSARLKSERNQATL